MSSHSSTTAVEQEELVDEGEAYNGSVVPSGVLGRLVYNTAYAVAFGVTVPVMVVVRVIPRDNVLVHGLVDGAAAARERVFPSAYAIEGESHDHETHALENGELGHETDGVHETSRRHKARRSSTPRKTTRATTRKKT